MTKETTLKELTQRMTDLESQVAFQEDMIDSLNQLVSRQSEELHLLQRHLRLVADKVAPLVDQQDGTPYNAADEKPPHY